MASAIVSEHPVSDETRATIFACRRDIESKHHVKVLFADESGSHGLSCRIQTRMP
jgi:hypothetical protein